MDQPRVFSYPLELVSAARFTDDPIPVEITLLHGLIVEAKGLASMLEQDGRGVHHVVRAVADVLERLEPLIAVDEATPQGESS